MNRRAFTLIELLVVIAIIAILSGIVAPMLSVGSSKTREFKCESNLGQLATAVHAYTEDYGAFPGELGKLDSILQDRELLSCTGTRDEYAYFPPPKDAARDLPVISCIDPKSPPRCWPHRFGRCYLVLTAGGEMRRVEKR